VEYINNWLTNVTKERKITMRNLFTLVVTLLTMTLLSSGMVLAAAPQITVPAPVPATDQVTAPATAPVAAATPTPEQANPHSLASRNAAALKLKAELDKLNAASSSQTK
jgi:hypothetical protein